MNRTLTFGITGARGFVGSELTRLLRDRGHRVIPLSRERPAGEEHFLPFALGETPSLDGLRGIDVLVHAAYDFRCRDAGEHRAKNVAGSIALLEQAAAAGVPHIVYISSLSAFEGCRSAYGRGKLEVERESLRLGGLVLRLGLVYANGDGGLAGSLRKLVRSLGVIPLPGKGGQLLYPLSTEGLATSLNRLVDKPVDVGRVVSLAEPRPLAFRDILRALARQEGKRALLVPFPWRAMWMALKALEMAGARLNFRSDSLLSLVNQDPNPDLTEARALGLTDSSFSARCNPAASGVPSPNVRRSSFETARSGGPR